MLGVANGNDEARRPITLDDFQYNFGDAVSNEVMENFLVKYSDPSCSANGTTAPPISAPTLFANETTAPPILAPTPFANFGTGQVTPLPVAPVQLTAPPTLIVQPMPDTSSVGTEQVIPPSVGSAPPPVAPASAQLTAPPILSANGQSAPDSSSAGTAQVTPPSVGSALPPVAAASEPLTAPAILSANSQSQATPDPSSAGTAQATASSVGSAPPQVQTPIAPTQLTSLPIDPVQLPPPPIQEGPASGQHTVPLPPNPSSVEAAPLAVQNFEPTKRSRQPSRRNEIANGIGKSKKRSSSGNGNSESTKWVVLAVLRLGY